MRFNPPPGWPVPPGDWQPPADWTPHPSWPAAPPGWQFWVEDTPAAPAEGLTAPDPAPGHLPADRTFTPTGPGYAPLRAGDPDPGTYPTTPAEPADTRGPLATYYTGLVLALVGAGSLLLSSGPRGGYLLWGALLFGAVLVFRAVAAYRRARAAGAPPLSRPAAVGAAVALVAVLAFTAYAGSRQAATIGLTDDVGSCWQLEDGDELFLVPCSGPHDYVVVDETRDPDACPMTTEGWVESDRGTALCLEGA